MPIIKTTRLPKDAKGRTKHTINGEPMAAPSQLQISQIDGDPGFYLFYCDAKGNEMNDAYFDTLEQAMEQAQWEFGVSAGDWQDSKK